MATILPEIQWVMNVIYAILTFVIALIVGKIVSRALAKFFEKNRIIQIIQRKTGTNVAKIAAGVFAFLIYIIGFILALNQFGLVGTVLNLISGAVLVLVIIVIFLSVKDIIPNAVAGVFVHSKGLVRQGDIIRVQDLEGKVVETTLIETKLMTTGGDIVYIPNAQLIKHEVIKKSHVVKKHAH